MVMGIVEAMSRVRAVVGQDCKLELEYDGEVCWLDISLPEVESLEELDAITNKLVREFILEKRDFRFSEPEEDFQVKIGFEVKLSPSEVETLEKLPFLRITVPVKKS